MRPIPVKNEKDALQHLGNNPDLIISSLNIPADRKSPLDRKECRGLSLLRITKAARPRVPYIILTSSIKDDQAADVTGLPASGLVILENKDQNWQDRLGSTLDKLLQGATAPGDAIVEIVFGLTETELAQYRIMTTQGSAVLPAQGNLTIDPRLLKKLSKETHSLSQFSYPGWHKKLTEIGEQLTDELLADQKFSKSFSDAVQAAGGPESTRIRFVIERDYHPLALEALLEPKYPVISFDNNPDSRFWMLKAPMTRKPTVQGRAGPLFADDETWSKPINCLIIEADVEGWAPGAGHLPKLSNVREEAEFLEQRLHTKKGGPGDRIGLVHRISLDTLPSGTSFRQRVEETLKGSTVWHLVHFAGHSHYDEESKEGSVFFPGAEPDGNSDRPIERVAIDEFAMCLDRTRFLYLSSCRNPEDNVGFDLARHGVPALVCFRWDIEDDKAGEYARTFYESLLEGPPSLERTFVKARHEVHERYRENRIWAAPMLILQA